MPTNDIPSAENVPDLKKQNQFSTLPILAWVLVIFLIIARIFIFQPVEVNGNSMLPTTHSGARWIVEEISAKITPKYQRGQIIVYCAETRNCDKDNVFARFSLTYYIKRIIGLPGESIEVKNSKTIIYNTENPNGMVLNEDYLSGSVKTVIENTTEFDQPLKKIPNDSYFIMGDNRIDSIDSRVFGPVSEKALLGKVWIQFWPLLEADTFQLPKYKNSPYIPETSQSKS